MPLYAGTRFAFTLAACATMLCAQEAEELMCESAANGKPEAVRAMLIRGADPNRQTRTGQTALTCAVSVLARNGDTRGVIIMLVDHGADPNLPDQSGRPPLIAALQGSASEYKIIPASEDAARLLIVRGAQVNVRDKDGGTPLITLLAQFADNPALVNFLVEKGADVNARRNDGMTGLMLAVRRHPSRSRGFCSTKAHASMRRTSTVLPP